MHEDSYHGQGYSVYSVGRAWYTLFVLQIAAVVAGMETAIITLLVHPIERTFQMNDVGFAAITVVPLYLGIAATYYPAGLLADTFRRRDMIAAGCVVWGLAALLSSRADASAMLFWARLMAGIGLGISGPSVFSTVTDAFPRARRAFATSIYLVGLSLGGGLGLTLCETLIQATQRHGPLHIGNFLFAPWQQCFVAVAVMAAAVLMLIFTLTEPPRRERVKVAGSNLASSLNIFGRYMWRNGLLWTVLLLAYTIYGAADYGAQVWAPTLGIRRFGVSGVGAIALLGSFRVAGAIVGPILGGLLAQRAINKGNPRSLPRLYVIIPAIGCVFAASFPYMPSWILAAAGVGVALAASVAMTVLVSIGIQETAPNDVRGQLVGLSGLIGFIPAIVGATLVAFLATHVFAHTGGLVPALAVIGGATGIVAVLLFAFAAAPFERAQRELRAIDTPSHIGIT